MSDRYYNLLRRLQMLDERLRLAQRLRRTDPIVIARLMILKLRIKDSLVALSRRNPALAAG